MGFSRGLEGLGDAHVELLCADGEPDPTAGSKARGLLKLGQPQKLAVEPPSLAFAVGRRRDLDVIKPFDEHSRQASC